MKKIKMFEPWGEWCFISNTGINKRKRIDNTAFEKRLRTINYKLNIYHKSPHKIRKTYGSILLDDGIDQNLIVQQMGHTSIAVTEKHYHRNRKHLDDKIRILDNIPELQKQKRNTNISKCVSFKKV